MIDIHAPKNETGLDELYVFCSVDPDGNRGICAHIMPGLGSTPMVTGSKVAAAVFKAFALTIAKATGKRVAMVKYTRGEELWTTNP
jgi:hypothetical protein